MTTPQTRYIGFCEVCGTYQAVSVRQEFAHLPAEREERYLLQHHEMHSEPRPCSGSGRMPDFVIEPHEL